MSPAKRITKKQMKEDKLVSSVFKTSEYIQKNPKPFFLGGAAVAVIFIAVVLVLWNIDKKNTQSAGYLVRAQISYDRGMTDDAVIDLQTVVDSYSNTSAAASACLILANIYFENGNYEEARKYFAIMIEKYPEDKMKLASAAAGAAACYEQKGDRLEAGRYYKMAADFYPDKMWAPQNLLNAGRNYMAAGDLESAKTAFNKITSDYKDSRELNTAKRFLSEIEI
ncbi:MAG: tetratricopeptide repeat protein [Candidatus Zixiibacteriota bacterium]|nr:MAG: tetratricopeptide repeat protein [candidate division Zixibacteria bacterium]